VRPAEYFENQILHYISSKEPTDSEIISHTEHNLDKALSFLPREMRRDLLDFYLEKYEKQEGVYKDFKEQVYQLAEVIALFTGDYNDYETGLTKEEWIFIRDLVSDYASILDEKLLTSIMSQVVSRGYI